MPCLLRRAIAHRRRFFVETSNGSPWFCRRGFYCACHSVWGRGYCFVVSRCRDCFCFSHRPCILARIFNSMRSSRFLPFWCKLFIETSNYNLGLLCGCGICIARHPSGGMRRPGDIGKGFFISRKGFRTSKRPRRICLLRISIALRVCRNRGVQQRRLPIFVRRPRPAQRVVPKCILFL